MGEQRVAVEQPVRASVEQVWEVLTDVAHADRTLSAVTRVEPLTDGPYRVGTAWRETRRMLGKEVTERMEVTAVEAPTRTVVESDSSGAHYVTEFALRPAAAGGTLLAMSFTAAPGASATRVTRALGALLGPLGARAARKMMVEDLRDIAARAERG